MVEKVVCKKLVCIVLVCKDFSMEIEWFQVKFEYVQKQVVIEVQVKVECIEKCIVIQQGVIVKVMVWFNELEKECDEVCGLFMFGILVDEV